jgi:hypothetical protein
MDDLDADADGTRRPRRRRAGGRLFTFGGEGNPADPQGIFPQVEVYDPASDRWSGLPDLPTPRHGMGAAVSGEQIYVPGGATVAGFRASDANEALLPYCKQRWRAALPRGRPAWRARYGAAAAPTFAAPAQQNRVDRVQKKRPGAAADYSSAGGARGTVVHVRTRVGGPLARGRHGARLPVGAHLQRRRRA